MQRPSSSLTSVTIGTDRPRELADFYAGLLGWRVTADEPAQPGEPAHGGWAQIAPSARQRGPTLNFEYEQHVAAPVWPAPSGHPFCLFT